LPSLDQNYVECLVSAGRPRRAREVCEYVLSSHPRESGRFFREFLEDEVAEASPSRRVAANPPDQPSRVGRLSWELVGQLFNALVGAEPRTDLGASEPLPTKAWTPDLIAGINRGGAIVGGMLAKLLKMSGRHGLIHIVAHERRGLEVLQPLLLPELDEPPCRVLIADDAYNSGYHLSLARRALYERYGDETNIRQAVLVFVEPKDPAVADLAPDYYGVLLKSREYEFPWSPGLAGFETVGD
jgi:hypoxanthine phosphoribosyltransferase